MANILVIGDELSITKPLRSSLEADGYTIVAILNGEDAMQFALRETPNIIILDTMVTGIDAYEATRCLRNHPKSMHIPIIILSERGEVAVKVRAFEAGIDDYITKPFDDDELLARIYAQLRRMQQRFLSPLTGLPGGLQIEQAIKNSLGHLEPWSILYLDLDNFKAFNDVYGFLAGNSLISLVGRICRRVVYEYGNVHDFVGHIGGDDFVIMTTPDRAQALSIHIVARYKQESITLYRPEDRERGSISGVDRKGRPFQFPLVSLSIGEVSNHIRQPDSMQEMSYLTAEAKYHAKQSTSSIDSSPLRWEPGYREYPPSVPLSSSSLLSPSLSTVGHLQHDATYRLENP